MDVESVEEVLYKIVLVGDSGVGKTAFISRYCDDHFDPVFIQTVGIDFKQKVLTRNNERINLQIWDTAGQERYEAITTAYYHGAHGFILMFDLTNKESFQACSKWLQKIEELAPENVVILLVGSKADLTEERAVSNEDAQAFAESSTMKYLEASAKEDTKISESFNYLVDAIIENNSKEPEVDVPKERSVKLTREPIPEPKPEEPQPTSDSGSSSRCLC